MVRTQEAWLSRIYVLYVKGSFKCLWPNFFNGSEIFNKVIYQLLLIKFIVIGQTRLFLLRCILQFIGNSFAKFDILLYFCISCLFTAYTGYIVYVKVLHHPSLIWLKDCSLKSVTLLQHHKTFYMKYHLLMRWDIYADNFRNPCEVVRDWIS